MAVRDGLAANGRRPSYGKGLSVTEQTAPTTGTEETNNSQQTETAKEFQAITSQEDFDKAISARIARERAKFADYDQLKAAQAELDTIRESQKTEAQKQQEALDQAQRELAEERTARARAEVAAATGVPANLLSGSTVEELTASAEALIQFRGEAASTPQKLHVPGEGGAPMSLNGDGLESALKQALGIN